MQPSPVKKVVLKTFGGRDVTITSKAARQLLEAKLLTGLIKHLRPGLVPDLISAPLMAKEAGIEVLGVRVCVCVNMYVCRYWMCVYVCKYGDYI